MVLGGCKSFLVLVTTPVSEQNKFLSGVKTVQILQFTRHDLKKKLISAPTITKLKIWRRQFLLRYLVEPNKFCHLRRTGPEPLHESNFRSNHVCCSSARLVFEIQLTLKTKCLKRISESHSIHGM